MTIRFLTAILLVMILFTGCTTEFMDEGDFFFISRNEAVMPVWVKGNTDSDTVIIYLHGGPNDGCIHFALAGWPLLEDAYRMVWWDQRHAGQSQGNPDISKTSMEDYISDLELLVNTINHQYEPDSIILMGTSWGSAVGLAYFSLSTAIPEEVDGFISLFGTHDFTYSYEVSRTRIMAIADTKISIPEDVEFWQQARAFYTDHTELHSLEDFHEHFTYIRGADGFTLEGSLSHVENSFSADYIFASPVASLPMMMTNGVADSNAVFMERILNDDRLSTAGALTGITVPALIIAGGKDLTAPKEVSEYIDGELQNSSAIILPGSAHFSFGTQEDLDLFNSGITDFINSL